MSLIQDISQSIKLPSDTIQFAKDGKYEEAWIISLDDIQPSDKEIKKYIESNDYKNLIVEYIWNQNIDEQRYVLTVIKDESCQEKNDIQFVQKCLNIFYQKLSFSETLKSIDKEIIGHEFLLKHPVQKVRLGIFNHWFSTGPIEMWNKGEKFNRAMIENKIKARPEIAKTKLNYQGLAFIYNFDGSFLGPYHVLKTPTCHKQNNEWIVDISLVCQNMKRIIEI